MESLPGYECKYSATGDCSPINEGSPLVVCELCHSPICSNHISPYDSGCCAGCIKPESIAVKESPLIDDDGVIHKGRVIQPVGITYKTLAKRLIEMTEDELIAHIHHVREQIKEAESVLDYRRIDLSSSTTELEERQIAKRKNLRIKNVEMISSGGIKIGITSSEKRKKALDETAKKLKVVASALNFQINGPEDLARLALAIKAINEKKAMEARLRKEADV